MIFDVLIPEDEIDGLFDLWKLEEDEDGSDGGSDGRGGESSR